MIKNMKKNLKKECFVAECNNLPFENSSFDYVFAYSVFHYFPNIDYSKTAINEMLRVAKKGIFIGDLPFESHDKNHLLYSAEDFSDWCITPGFYNCKRFNVFKLKI